MPTSDIDTDQNTEMKIDCLKEGDYIVVKLTTVKGSTKEFAAKILSKHEENSFFCSFLRPSNKILNAFIFPTVEDTGVVDKNEILKILPAPTFHRRGAIIFKGYCL